MTGPGPGCIRGQTLSKSDNGAPQGNLGILRVPHRCVFHYNRSKLIASGRHFISERMKKKGNRRSWGALMHLPTALTDNPDRRANPRFPIFCEVAYKVLNSKGAIEIGAGQTVNISSTGVLFKAEAPLPPGSRVKLSIRWPVQLDGKCGLKLVARGRIVRFQGTTVALEIEKYEFRTGPVKQVAGSPLQHMPAIPTVRGAGVAFMELRAGTRGRYYDGSSAGEPQDSA